jgi:hypothetical protein
MITLQHSEKRDIFARIYEYVYIYIYVYINMKRGRKEKNIKII